MTKTTTENAILDSLNFHGKNYKTTIIAVDDLTPWEGNPRVISEEAIEVVAKSIREFGFYNPIVCNQDNIIINGHTRLEAAKKCRLNSVPCYKITLDPKRFQSLNIMDNKSGEYTTWDDELLKQSLLEIESLDSDFLDACGFSDDELEKLLAFEEEKPEKKKPKKESGGMADRSQVKMIQIFLNKEMFNEFQDKCEELKEIYQVESLTEVIATAVEFAHDACIGDGK